MTGAGSGEFGFALEDSYGNLPADPEWIQPFIDPEVGSASLDRSLNRARKPGDPRPAGSRPGNREGALTVTGTLANTDFHDLVFADGGTALASEAMLAPTATWYLGSQTLPDMEERFATGAAVESVTWNWQQGEDVTVELNIIYGDEGDLATPSTITQPAVEDVSGSYATTFEIDAASVEMLQSLTLEIAGMARFRRGQQQTPVDAVVGAYEPSMTVEAVLQDGTKQSLVYGSSSASTPQDEIDTSPATLTFNNAAGEIATYNIQDIQPTSYDWSNLISSDDTTDPTEFHVRTVEVA